MIETHRSMVAPAECDANRHMNVSHYVRRFSEAGQSFLAMHGETGWYRPSNRHFRFHRELEDASRVTVLSVVVGAGPHRGQILHVMQEADRGFVAATCLDSDFDSPGDGLPATAGGPPAKALPRGLPAGRFEPADTPALIGERLATVAHRNRVQPGECAGDGRMGDGELVARFFSAASQLWAYVGFEAAWFGEKGYGGAAIEMKLTLHAPIAAGRDYAIVSWVPDIKGRMLPLSNQMVGVPDGAPLASISALSVVMDRATRLAVDIPPEVRRKHAARFGDVQRMAGF